MSKTLSQWFVTLLVYFKFIHIDGVINLNVQHQYMEIYSMRFLFE